MLADPGESQGGGRTQPGQQGEPGAKRRKGREQRVQQGVADAGCHCANRASQASPSPSANVVQAGRGALGVTVQHGRPTVGECMGQHGGRLRPVQAVAFQVQVADQGLAAANG